MDILCWVVVQGDRMVGGSWGTQGEETVGPVGNDDPTVYGLQLSAPAP